MDTSSSLGKLLRDARLRLGLNQEQVAAALGVQASDVSAFELGRRQWPRVHVPALARILGITQYEMAVAAGLIEREPITPPAAPADPRLVQLIERLATIRDQRKAWAAIDLVLQSVERATEALLEDEDERAAG